MKSGCEYESVDDVAYHIHSFKEYNFGDNMGIHLMGYHDTLFF